MTQLRDYIDMESYGVVPEESLELAWAAGFFEGEGSVYVDQPGRGLKYPKLRLFVGQKNDPWPVYRFKRAVEDTRLNGVTADVRGVTQWAIQGQGAHQIMERLRPYLGEESKKVRRYLRALEEGATDRDGREQPDRHGRS